MVFVAVSQDDCGQVVAILFEKVEIGNRNVHTERRFFRKAHPGVHDDHLIGVPDAHAVHPKFADAAKRNYFNFLHSDPIKPKLEYSTRKYTAIRAIPRRFGIALDRSKERTSRGSV